MPLKNPVEASIPVTSLHLEALGGISGDMFASAFLDVHPELMMDIRNAVEKMELENHVECDANAHGDGVLNGTRFLVRNEFPKASYHTPWKDLRRRISDAGLEEGILKNTLGIFEMLAEAEAIVHGIAPESVVFHEVGSVDSIVDILAASIIIHAHPNVQWFLGSLPLGRGEVQTDHGKMPLPAPAVMELLKGFEFQDDGEMGERVTPTGAAILRFLSERKGLSQNPDGIQRNLITSGLGFGTRKLKSKSNVLRVTFFGARRQSFSEEKLWVLRFEVDDQSPEDLAIGLEHLRNAEGVLDVVQWPVFSKKGRIAFSVQVLVETEAAESIIQKIFLETTTLGVRYHEESRKILERDSVEVEGSRVKLAYRSSETTAKMEMDDLKEVPGYEQRTYLRRKSENAALEKHGQKK